MQSIALIACLLIGESRVEEMNHYVYDTEAPWQQRKSRALQTRFVPSQLLEMCSSGHNRRLHRIAYAREWLERMGLALFIREIITSHDSSGRSRCVTTPSARMSLSTIMFDTSATYGWRNCGVSGCNTGEHKSMTARWVWCSAAAGTRSWGCLASLANTTSAPARGSRCSLRPVTASVSPLQEHVMRPLRYSINVTLDGCCDHRAGSTDEELHRYWAENLAQADALLFGRVTYEMMEAAWRPPATGVRPDWMADWMEPFARTIDAAKKYVVSSTLDRVDWNAELVRGDLGKAVQQLKRESGKGLFVGGVKLPLALAELGLIDEYEFVVHPRLAGHGPTLFAGLSKHIDLKLVSRLEFGSGAVAMRYEPRR